MSISEAEKIERVFRRDPQLVSGVLRMNNQERVKTHVASCKSTG